MKQKRIIQFLATFAVWICFSMGSIMIGSSVSWAGPEIRPVQPAPDYEKRSCIMEADGYAFLSENMTLAQTRAGAFAEAKRRAVEKAKTYIQSKTRIEDFVVTMDDVTSTSAGAVTILDEKDFGIEDNLRYHVWIKAEVDYDLKPKDPGAVVRTQIDDPTLKVKVWTSKKTYKTDENIEIFIQGNRNFYAAIMDITSGGEIIQLLPNDYRNINYFEAGKTYKIPDYEDNFEITVSPPYGEDQIVVYASENPLGDAPLASLGQGLRVFRGKQESLSKKLRGVSIAPKKKENKTTPASTAETVSGAEFYEGRWTFRTEP